MKKAACYVVLLMTHLANGGMMCDVIQSWCIGHSVDFEDSC